MQREATSAPSLALLTGGLQFEGWKQVRVTRSMEHCAGSFTIGVSQLWPGQDHTRRIQPGERCEVRIGTERVITGHVDAVEIGVDAAQHEVQISGRDATADLVDCSAVARSGQWRGQRIESIASDLAQPFGVAVRADVDTGKPLPTFALQEGESAFDAIERAARIRALLVVSDGAGNLVITRAGINRVSTQLVLGTNILSARATLDMRDRFSEYRVKGQAPGSDLFNAASVSQIQARAADPGVPRYRPLVITNDAPDLAATLQQRAQWEATVRAARSTRIEVTVAGWSHAEGLWQPNTLVAVRGDMLRLDDELLISAVEYELSERGTVATLTLTRADAFTTLAIRSARPGGMFAWDLPRSTAAGGGQ